MRPSHNSRPTKPSSGRADCSKPSGGTAILIRTENRRSASRGLAAALMERPGDNR
jgi:hypothetical protein